METPSPLNTNTLKNILANAKKVMQKVESDKPIKQTGRITEALSETQVSNTQNYNENDEREPNYSTQKITSFDSTKPKIYTPEQVMSSKLPSVIKEAMLKHPIPQLQGPPSKFSLEDMADLIDKPKFASSTKSNERINNNSDVITISKSELKNMINESIIQFLVQSYNKNLTENAIKQTINTLIKEGKINIKKK